MIATQYYIKVGRKWTRNVTELLENGMAQIQRVSVHNKGLVYRF